MHGSADQITSFKQTRSFVMNAGNRTTYKEWPGCYHELHNDTMADEVFRFLVDWLNKQVITSDPVWIDFAPWSKFPVCKGQDQLSDALPVHGFLLC